MIKVEYTEDLENALTKARETAARSQRHGRYVGPGEIGFSEPADVNRSILDLAGISEEPLIGYVAPVSCEECWEYFGTAEPTEQMVMDADCFWADIGRGAARCVTLYEGGYPKEILFAGYSFD